MVILGRNGAGKTTFVNSIFGLVPFISGSIYFQSKDLRKLSPDRIKACSIAYFMQGAPVFQQMTVRENLAFAAGGLMGRDLNTSIDKLKESLALLKEADIEAMPAGSLSGGERTQLAIAMAMISQPALLILDEPFAGLSPTNANLVLKILEEYAENTSAAIIMIAQDRKFASAFSTKQFLIRDRKIIKE